ncbi:MAG: hypothetical protein LBF72_00735 [Holosporales bacterium]|nr:hypothetical protein [Holosporales bacterium]
MCGSFFILLYTIILIFRHQEGKHIGYFLNIYALFSSVILLVFFSFSLKDTMGVFFVFCILVCAVCQILVGMCLVERPKQALSGRYSNESSNFRQ